MASEKAIDLRNSVYEVCTKYPELIEMMKELGFVDIVKPGMLETAGRFMTLPKGAKMKGIDLGDIRHKLESLGFTVTP